MSRKESEAVTGTVRFVALIREELVAASAALHRLMEIANAKPLDKDALGRAQLDAINLCLVALWHANECESEATTFVVMPTPAKVLARAMNNRSVPTVKTEPPR